MAHTARTLELFVPGLLGPMPGLAQLTKELPPLAVLETCLSRARMEAGGPAGFERGLFALFGLAFGPDEELPVAPVTRLLDGGEPDQAFWLRADPVYLQPDRDRLLLLGHEDLQLSPTEAQALAADIERQFAEEGWQLQALAPHRWYLRPPQPPRLLTQPLSRALGQDVRPLLPAGEDARQWRRLLNEVQMLLHAAPVNAARESAGQHPANSLWFWGGGRLPHIEHGAWAGVWSDADLACGLARLAAVPYHPLPSDGQAWLGELGAAHGRFLVVIDTLLGPALGGDTVGWVERLAWLQEAWLAPLARALRAGQLQDIALLAGDARRLRLTRRRLRAWWRPRRRLSALVPATPGAGAGG